MALSTLEPFYCAWLCPLRIVYDPPAAIFVSGGIISLIGGPLLTKRLYRRLIYPLPPVSAIIGRLSPFRIRVDRGVCMDCEICEETCEDLLHDQRITSQRRDGDGVHQMHGYLPNGAIDYRLIGTEIGVRPIFVVLGTPNQMVYPIYALKLRPRHP